MIHSNIPMFGACFFGGLLSTMNLWAWHFSHLRFSFNDVYMALIMTGWMFLILGIYYKDFTQIQIGLFSIIPAFFAIRYQIFINDFQYIRGMIPHHSMAILMSEKIKEKTTRQDIYKFADDISKTQLKEIDIMNLITSNSQIP